MNAIVANDNHRRGDDVYGLKDVLRGTHHGSRGVQEGLSGVRVLVVEDDPVLLIDLECTLSDAGATIVGLCQTLNEALSRTVETDFSVAVLDFQLGSETITPVARRLENRGVPFVLYTAQSRDEDGVAEWREIAAIVEKPSPPSVLVSAVRAAVSR